MDYYTGKRPHPFNQKQYNSLTKNQILQQYRQTQKQKSILKNKLNILKKSCERNQKKAKTLQSQLKKVNKIKQNYSKDRNQIQQLLRKNKLDQQRKKVEISERKQQVRGKVPYIKRMLQRQRSNDYIDMKKKQFEMQKKIKIYRNTIITERKKTIYKAKEDEEIGKMNRTLYLQLKKKSARLHVEKQASVVSKKYMKSRQELDNMKQLQESLMNKLNQSRTSLRSCMSKINRNRGLRA